MRKVRLTAKEDLRYSIMRSYPFEGFLVKEGQTIVVLASALPLLTIKPDGRRGRAKYEMETYE